MSEQKKEYRIDGRPSTIYRVVKNASNPYVMIDRRPIDNPALSFKAKGILTYLMSRPDGWEVSVADLIKHATDGEGGVRSGLKELKLAGHMKYTVSRKSGRITGWLIEVFEVPFSPDCQFQDVVIQDVENRTQVLSTLSNKEYSTSAENIFKIYQDNIAMIVPKTREMLLDIEHTYPDGWFEDAVKEALKANVRKLNYVVSILERWGVEGKGKKKNDAKRESIEIQRDDHGIIKSW